MTIQRINLTTTQINQKVERAVRRARNGAINKCLDIVKKHLNRYLTVPTFARCIVPYGKIVAVKKEIAALRK